MSVFNANLQITKSKVKNGEIVDLEINGKNIELGSDVPMDANKEQTINVSTYTQPVVITPSSGKKGMKKVTVTLSNIPSGGSNTLYAWGGNDKIAYTMTATPTTSDKAFLPDDMLPVQDIMEVGEDTITTGVGTFTRYSDGDIQL